MMIDYLGDICLAILLLPLSAAVIVGVFGYNINNGSAHRITTVSVFISAILSGWLVKYLIIDGHQRQVVPLYSWLNGSKVFAYDFSFGLLIDNLTAIMLLVVSIVATVVHYYSIGYMQQDPGYKRFFSYISLFTFSMYLLVLANNFLQLFIAWEGVGLASFLLISFWYKKPAACYGGMKAFLVNRVGDLGLLLSMALIYYYVGSLDYGVLFVKKQQLVENVISIGNLDVPAVTVICLLMFWGAMGKSAQIPLHVWLPESMEGPTPISALIHAATMVTAGVFLLARMSPIFELSTVTLSVIGIVGATSALLMGLIAIVKSDIKQIVAYSTLSQLGYMMVAMGLSCYQVGIFHLVTHAFFKALLFLGAGAVIVAMHHQQDIRRMGGLKQHLPLTYVCCLVGALALVAIPPFAGFYSKELIISAANNAVIFGSGYISFCVTTGAMITAIYTFRWLFMIFHGQLRTENLQVIVVPFTIKLSLLVLTILSLVVGYWLLEPLAMDPVGVLNNSIMSAGANNIMMKLQDAYQGQLAFVLHSMLSVSFGLTLAGIAVAYLGYVKYPLMPSIIATNIRYLYQLCQQKFGFDCLYNYLFVNGIQQLSKICANIVDTVIIDNLLVDGFAKSVRKVGALLRKTQTGIVNHYIVLMVFSSLILITWWTTG